MIIEAYYNDDKNLEIDDSFDGEGDLEVCISEMGETTVYFYLTKSQVTELRDHLNKLLGE